MKIYCRGCNNIVKTKKTKDKNNNHITETYFCKECGAAVFRVIENRRKDLR